MTVSELREEFDILYNSIASNLCPELDNYEKSVILTQAQEELIKAYLNPRANKTLQGFDDSNLRKGELRSLITTAEGEECTDNNIVKINNSSVLYYLPENVFIPINESVFIGEDLNNAEVYRVYQLPFSEYEELIIKPYKFPPKFIIWKLINSTQPEPGTTSSGPKKTLVELIVNPNEVENIQKYIIRYIKTPDPIILDALPEGLTINGKNSVSAGVLPIEMKAELLRRAVEIARDAYTGPTEQAAAQIQAGYAFGNSSTQVGVISKTS